MPSVGESGPLRDILAYAPIIQALSGLMSLVGYAEDEQLVGELQAPEAVDHRVVELDEESRIADSKTRVIEA